MLSYLTQRKNYKFVNITMFLCWLLPVADSCILTYSVRDSYEIVLFCKSYILSFAIFPQILMHDEPWPGGDGTPGIRRSGISGPTGTPQVPCVGHNFTSLEHCLKSNGIKSRSCDGILPTQEVMNLRWTLWI